MAKAIVLIVDLIIVRCNCWLLQKAIVLIVGQFKFRSVVSIAQFRVNIYFNWPLTQAANPRMASQAGSGFNPQAGPEP
jgi:hypothetical protein